MAVSEDSAARAEDAKSSAGPQDRPDGGAATAAAPAGDPAPGAAGGDAGPRPNADAPRDAQDAKKNGDSAGAPAAAAADGKEEKTGAPAAADAGDEKAAAADGEGGDGEQEEEEEEEEGPQGPQLPNLLLFRKWNLEGIEVHDPGLVNAISLRRMILPYTYGRSALKKFNKADANIVERLANKMMHFGKRYAKNTGRMAGKKTSVLRTVEAAFEIIHIQTGRNPVEVLVRAVEHSAPNEDTTRIVYGGAVYHVSVDVSPLRRVDLALRFIADGVKEAAFSRPRAVEECLADHLMLAAANDQNAPSVKKKHELERIAQASR